MHPNARWAFARYRAVAHRLPQPQDWPKRTYRVLDLQYVLKRYDGFILDAFGILNVGEGVLPQAVERVAQMRALGKKVVVLTNGAASPRAEALAKYRKWGFDFTEAEVIASRDLAGAALKGRGGVWAAIAPDGAGFEDLPGDVRPLDERLLAEADGFLFLGSQGWDDDRQAALVAALQARPRPVICANPDMVAPREEGFTWEPGHYAHALPVPVEFHGKPYPGAFEVALRALELRPARVAMVGDTLHTDVLGGRMAGCGTVLVTGHGFFKGVDPDPFIEATGILPDYIADET
ncbi:HAD-IIA family hydrolase [Pararhodobacter sp.]|uniref:HAD-IIA family hydrolase n=1 Tax=Pararhodobacter sp. TaxID=2127056 RepID=UPI002AFE1A36|nr:HAD hydrolase-like protein [Pararhodobacter sp.]